MYSHNDINDDIRFLAKSEIRLKILSELYDHPNNVKGLVNETNITYSSVSSNVNKLEQNNYIRKVKNKYYINPMAKIYYETLIDFKNSVDIINDFNSFWYKHNVNQLSIDSMQNITYLKDSRLIETTPIDIYKTHNIMKTQLNESKNIKAIFPYLHPDYPELIEEILKNNGSVELIIQKDILKAILECINEEIKKNSLRKGNLKLHPVKYELNLYLAICDDEMSLGLFKNDGSFDQNRILISDDKKSQEWGEKLFDQIKSKVIQ